MPKAEVGTPKYVANQMKAKGLQRLRWYCQICEKQCRDENGFKCHTQSESHVRNMLRVGENAGKSINQYSNQFKRDFITLLRTGHGEKKINANRFYQEYIRDKNHIHMNATRWTTLNEFVKYLGREGICRVEQTDEEGLTIAYVDSSPEALKRKDAARRKELSEKGDEEVAQMILQRQVEQAQKAQAEKLEKDAEKKTEESSELKRADSKPLQLSFNKTDKDEVKDAEDKPPTTATASKPKPGSVFARMKKPKTSENKVKKAETKPQQPMNAFQRVMMKDQRFRKT